MGKNKQKEQQQQTTQSLSDIGSRAGAQYDQLFSGPSELQNMAMPVTQNYQDLFNKANYRQMQDYGDIMQGYRDFGANVAGGGPTKFGFERVKAERPAELGEAYGYLRETMPGYREFAKTGGYSPTDIQELRARGVAPIRSAYGNTMMEMNRARAIGGAGGAPNYIAAASKAQRELPGQMADAMTNVNAQLAQDIRQGRLAGLAGMHGVGGTMGGLSSQEAGRMLQAALANQSADLQAQQLSAADKNQNAQLQLAALQGQTGLYGTTPAMSALFGNQAQNSFQQQMGLEQMRNQFGLGLLGAQMNALQSPQLQQQPGTPWWKTALGIGAQVAPYAMSYFGNRGAGGKAPIMPTKNYGGMSGTMPAVTGM